jgi:hypothetical protein
MRGKGDKMTELVAVRLTLELAETLDDWRRAQKDIPNRAEAIRTLMLKGLAAEKVPLPAEAKKPAKGGRK